MDTFVELKIATEMINGLQDQIIILGCICALLLMVNFCYALFINSLNKKVRKLENEKGFTLVELLAVIIILGIVFSIAIPKVISMNKNAEAKGIESAIVDLNLRELEKWTNLKLEGNYTGDAELFPQVDRSIPQYSWSFLSVTGGVLQFKETSEKLHRQESTHNTPPKWRKEVKNE